MDKDKSKPEFSDGIGLGESSGDVVSRRSPGFGGGFCFHDDDEFSNKGV